MVSSDAVVAEGVASLMERFNWTRVAVISQQETIFTSVSQSMVDDMSLCLLHLETF